MGLIVNAEREVDWPVEILVPIDGGQVEKHKVMVRYRLATQTDFFGEGDNPPKDKLLPEHIKGWGTEAENYMDGFMLDEKTPMPFNQENLAAILKIGYIERAITLGLVNASNGAATKN